MPPPEPLRGRARIAITTSEYSAHFIFGLFAAARNITDLRQIVQNRIMPDEFVPENREFLPTAECGAGRAVASFRGDVDVFDEFGRCGV